MCLLGHLESHQTDREDLLSHVPQETQGCLPATRGGWAVGEKWGERVTAVGEEEGKGYSNRKALVVQEEAAWLSHFP